MVRTRNGSLTAPQEEVSVTSYVYNKAALQRRQLQLAQARAKRQVTKIAGCAYESKLIKATTLKQPELLEGGTQKAE